VATDVAGRSAAVSVHVVVRDNLKVGHFSVSFVDLEVPVAGLPIRVTRTYDSRDKGKGDFGHGWRLELSTMRVAENGTGGLGWQGVSTGGFFPAYCLPAGRPHVVTVTLPGGRVQEFDMVVSPACQPFIPPDLVTVSYRPRPGSLGTLAPMGDGEAWVAGSWPGNIELYGVTQFDLFDPIAYEYTAPDGRKFVVHEGEGVKRLTDLNGNQLVVSPGGITHSAGKGIVFTRDGQGRITRITDPAGAAMDYAYDANGDLVSYTDREDDTVGYAYHPDFPHHLERIIDPLGRTPIRNEYYDDGRLRSHTDAFGQTITYAHDVAGRQEIVTDRNGAVRLLEYDDRGNVTRETQPDGKVVRRTFDARNNRIVETVPHDPADPAPPTSTYVYDASEYLLAATDPEGNRTEYTYNAQGQVLTIEDPRGQVTTNAYDSRGNLASTTDAAGGVTTYTYDGQGNVTTQTVAVDGAVHTTAYAYDGAGNLARETDATGHVTTYAYDANGNRRQQATTRTTTSGPESLTTTFNYDGQGRLVETNDADGSSTRTVYDALGRQVEAFDKLGRRTGFEYDEMGRLVRTRYPDGTVEESGYDPEGRRTSFRDRGGRTTAYAYDAVGRLTRTTFADGAFTENAYDAAGRLVAVKDGRGKITAAPRAS
jgi:YD repeat-containing protein